MSATDQVEAIAYRASLRARTADMSRWLLDHLGQRITTVALGLADASVVRRYAKDQVRPPVEREARLRLLFRVSRMVADAYDDDTARAFLMGANPQLGDRSPLLVIADDPPEVAGPEVIGAARALLQG
jgi:uncharacterized protein (DUF2384 family)